MNDTKLFTARDLELRNWTGQVASANEEATAKFLAELIKKKKTPFKNKFSTVMKLGSSR